MIFPYLKEHMYVCWAKKFSYGKCRIFCKIKGLVLLELVELGARYHLIKSNGWIVEDGCVEDYGNEAKDGRGVAWSVLVIENVLMLP
jgi:hypothetical protein